MDSPQDKFGLFLHFNAFPSVFWALVFLALLGLLLGLGRRLEPALKLERLGIPIALLVGIIALLIGPYGILPLMPHEIADIWVQLPTPLLALIFATLMLGRPLPKVEGLWKPVASQAFLGLLLGFGQYFVGGLVVFYFLVPALDVDPLMACLIEVGFEGGHGAAAVMGESFSRLGFEGGADLGLAMATIGLLSSTIIGTILVVIGRWKCWVVPDSPDYQGSTGALEESIGFWDRLKQLVVNLGLVGCSVLLGIFMLKILRLSAPYLGGVYEEVLNVLPVFPFALIGSLLVRWILELSDSTYLSSQLLQREIGTLTTDLLITTAMASLNLPLLLNDWIPIAVLSITGLTWNLCGILFLARFLIKKEWFERSITEFGNATGVAASGLLLLRLSDPKNLTNALPIFSVKQLFLQPLLSGGVVTVLAPILLNQFGLKEWTELSGLITIVFIALGFLIQSD